MQYSSKSHGDPISGGITYSSFLIDRKETIDELIEALPLDSSGEFDKLIPFDKLTVEAAVYWLSLIGYLQKNDISRKRLGDDDDDDDEDAESLDRVHEVICELSTFCDYLTK